jgi:hypothetical protein
MVDALLCSGTYGVGGVAPTYPEIRVGRPYVADGSFTRVPGTWGA